MKLLSKYWGKAENSAWHPLPCHCMDVVAVADQWWEHSPSIRHSFSQETGLTDEQSYAWIMFFVALHDLGKFDVRFQMKVLDLAEKNYNENLPNNLGIKDYFHGDEGYKWFVLESDIYFENIANRQQDWLQNWFAAVAGHHGSIPTNAEPNFPPFVDKSITVQDCLARQMLIQELNRIFLEPAGINFDNIPTENPPVLLAGFCSVCDWLGSNREYFEFQQTEASLEDYFSSRKENALKALNDFGLLAHVHTIGGMQALYPDYTPQDIQTLIDRLSVEQSLIIVEASTGSGKTEAALAYASKLLANSLADSIVFALPTQATANAMLERLENVAYKIFESNDNVILAHGKRDFNKHFIEMIKRHKQSISPQGDLEAGAQCSEWLSSSRKRAFLGQIAVTTVDQVMLSAITPLKHYFVRSFGIGKGVLIIDEIHAYDAYMYGILEAVIKQQKQAGGSVILLSATLPAYQKQALLHNAWGVESAIDEQAYPLILQAIDNDIHIFKLENSDPSQDKKVELELWKSDDCSITAKQLEQIVKAAESGAKVGIVCNLVDDAQKYANILSNITSVPVDIFHSRYRYCDRMNKEKAVLDNYGKKSPEGGRILVGTQVIEQSLDIDFDWLISFVCPVDLLFQRMGRLHRHVKPRPESHKKVLCTVVLPTIDNAKLYEEPKKIYGLHDLIYKNTRVLWRTQCLLEQNDSIKFPSAYREWIERVYAKSTWDNEPESLTKLHEEYEMDQWASKCVAKGLTQANTYFRDSEGNTSSLTREGEMNLSVIPVVESNGLRYFLDGTPVSKPCDKYDHEQLSQNSLGVPTSWQRLLPKCQDDLYFVSMVKADDGWRFDYDDGYLLYTQDRGLQKVKHEKL